MPRLPPPKICSRCGFSKEESESLCQRCRNGQERYFTYIRTSSRCAKCGGIKNDVEQICEYCRNAQELPKIIQPLRPTVSLHEQAQQ
jgi:predicted amidophosphoribosyltransferase